MTNEQLRSDDSADNTLIHLDTESRANLAHDINAKINLLENSLDELQSELDVINRSVGEGLERLSDKDLDLTSKVSETYKRLGEIDNTYKSLSSISENIDTEVKKLATDIVDVSKRSAADLEELQSSSSGKSTELAQQHDQLVEHVNKLVQNSQETGEQLSQSIHDNTDALLKLEKELVAEIDALANATNERSENIENEVEIGRARILQLQAIDDALEKRAASLETNAAELTQKTRELHASTNMLEMRTDELSSIVDKLLETSANHGSMITAIQNNAAQLGRSLAALTGTEKKHFRILSGAFVVALIAVALLYFYQQSIVQDDALLTAERTQVIDQQITGLQAENQLSSASMSDMQNDLVVLNKKLAAEVNSIEHKMQGMDDQVQSLDGRINDISPFSQFGKNSIIHGPQWLAEQNADSYVIQLASVTDKKELYEIAQRYSHYLKDELSYYTLSNTRGNSYVLVSSGYDSERKAAGTLWNMPRYINHQRPIIVRMSTVQSRI